MTRTDRLEAGAQEGARGEQPERGRVRRLRRALLGFEPGLRILAESLPGCDGLVDLLAIDVDGRVVLVFFEPDEAESAVALALARALANRSWLRSQLPGWLQLAPDVEVTPRTEVRALLVARQLPAVVRAAIDGLPPRWIEPVVHRTFIHRGDEFLLLEHVDRPAPPSPAEPGSDEGGPERPLPAFRSGLSPGEWATADRSRGAPRFEAAERSVSAPGSPRDRAS